MIVISECCIDIAFEQFVLCVQNLRTMRLICLREGTNLEQIVSIGKDSFEGVTFDADKVDFLSPITMEITDKEKFKDFVDLSIQTSLQYEQIWLQNLFKVLDDCGIDFEHWKQSLQLLDLSNKNIVYQVIPLEKMNRHLPLEKKAIEGKSSVFARNMTKYQLDMVQKNRKLIEELVEEKQSLYFVVNTFCADIGFLAFGMYEEHVTAISDVGLDAALIEYTKLLQGELSSYLPQAPVE